MSYADLTALKLAMGISDTTDDTLLQLALDSATRFIDRYTGRSFVAEDAATKVFIPTSYTRLDLTPDLRSITSVAIDTAGDLSFAATLGATDYYQMPLQSRPDSGIYAWLDIAPNSGQLFAPGLQVRVVGDWGYVVDGAAPDDIQQACLIQASRLFKRREAPFGILQSVDLGQFTRIGKADPDVIALLNPYRRIGTFGGVY